MEIIKYNNQGVADLFGEREELTSNVEGTVKSIIADVRLNGDAALKKYTAQFDGYAGESLEDRKSVV